MNNEDINNSTFLSPRFFDLDLLKDLNEEYRKKISKNNEKQTELRKVFAEMKEKFENALRKNAVSARKKTIERLRKAKEDRKLRRKTRKIMRHLASEKQTIFRAIVLKNALLFLKRFRKDSKKIWKIFKIFVTQSTDNQVKSFFIISRSKSKRVISKSTTS